MHTGDVDVNAETFLSSLLHKHIPSVVSVSCHHPEWDLSLQLMSVRMAVSPVFTVVEDLSPGYPPSDFVLIYSIRGYVMFLCVHATREVLDVSSILDNQSRLSKR